ncbi:hypothetical protein NDU88_005410 [Pleurodeles waltl]|uniref:Uncharacterized protein n=1 Tax=Pleurodeles waltl TaxID=8319 RepID=A0AAV7RM88_PLEWA|nr:hypothetical protein NDU88_005410 [Pleurodeles waltl]
MTKPAAGEAEAATTLSVRGSAGEDKTTRQLGRTVRGPAPPTSRLPVLLVPRSSSTEQHPLIFSHPLPLAPAMGAAVFPHSLPEFTALSFILRTGSPKVGNKPQPPRAQLDSARPRAPDPSVPHSGREAEGEDHAPDAPRATDGIELVRLSPL